MGELAIIAADRVPVLSRRRVMLADFHGAETVYPEDSLILASILNCPV